ncbi:hypothetical protein LINPERPRIM_LOCUS38226, partial [Linum perenne]
MAMEQMAIGARLLGTAGALLSVDQAHRAEQPLGVEEMEAELREARAATQQWKAKYSKAKKEMDEEVARLLAEQQKRYKVENALTQAEADRDALKEKVVLLETDKADMAKDLGAKTKDLESRDLALKETEETLQALRADVKKAVAEKTAEELGDRVQGALDNTLAAVRHELRRGNVDCSWNQEQMFRSASRRLMAQEFKEESADSQVIPSDRRKELLAEAFSEVSLRHKELRKKARAEKSRADRAGSS